MGGRSGEPTPDRLDQQEAESEDHQPGLSPRVVRLVRDRPKVQTKGDSSATFAQASEAKWNPHESERKGDTDKSPDQIVFRQVREDTSERHREQHRTKTEPCGTPIKIGDER
jgi:hypothetical protein